MGDDKLIDGPSTGQKIALIFYIVRRCDFANIAQRQRRLAQD